MINRVNIIGNIVRDLELKKTQSSKSVLSFTIAVNNFNDETYYFDCIAWNKTAEFMSQYAQKGNKIAVDGRLQQRSYENKNGIKVNVVEIVADQVDLLTQKEQKKESVKDLVKGTQFETGPLVDITDSDLPF